MTTPDWAIGPSAPGVHNLPAPSAAWENISADQQKQLWNKLLESVWQQFVLWVQGFLSPGPAGPQLQQFFADLQADVVAFIRDTTGIDLTNWDTFTASLAAADDAAQQWVQQIIAPFVALINPLLGIEEQQNLLVAGDFKDAISFSAPAGWVWDAAVGHTAVGSAKATASGVTLALVSNPIAVVEGQQLDVSVWLKWSGVTATGTAFKLDVVTYNGADLVGTTTIASVSSPATNQASWQELTDVWSAPSGVTAARLRLAVENTTAGNIWWDDATVTKLTLLQQQANDTQDSNQEVIDRGVNSFLGLFGSGRTLNNLSDAFDGQADTAAANAAMWAQIQAQLGPGNPDADDFERTASTLGANWDAYSTGTGTTVTDGHDAVIGGGALATFEVVCRRNLKQAQGDLQRVDIVLDSAPASFGANGHNDLWLRMTSFSSWATRTGIRFRYSGSGLWTLDWFTAGTATNLAAQTLIPISPKAATGGTLSFIAGAGGVARRFVAALNGREFMDVTEVGTTSQYGSSYRYRGFGGKAENLLIPFNPGKLRQWTATG